MDISVSVSAETPDAADASLFCMVAQSIEMAVVAIQARGAIGSHARKNFSFSISNLFFTVEEFEMNGGDVCDDCYVWFCQFRKRGDLTGAVHADLKHAEARVSWQARETERQTPMSV